MKRELAVYPDWEDVEFAGRTLDMTFDGDAEAAALASELDAIAACIGPAAKPCARRSEPELPERQGVSVSVGFAVGDELAVLLLRRAANYIRGHGIPFSSESLVLSDPEEVEF